MSPTSCSPRSALKIQANQRFGEIESVKATSDLYSGVTGTVTAINDALAKTPGLVNTDPYKTGWMIKVKVDSPADVQKLLSVDDYLKTGRELCYVAAPATECPFRLIKK